MELLAAIITVNTSSIRSMADLACIVVFVEGATVGEGWWEGFAKVWWYYHVLLCYFWLIAVDCSSSVMCQCVLLRVVQHACPLAGHPLVCQTHNVQSGGTTLAS